MRLTYLLLLSFFSSCGWHVAEQEERTISIPYAYGDADGMLTSCLVQEMESRGGVSYVQEGGTLQLKVELLDTKSSPIGFRYDPQKLQDGKKRLIPDETRRRLLAKVEVIDTLSQKVILGPVSIVGSTDFDHQYYSLSHNINNFSLGQLTDVDTAYEVVDIPLYRDLAHQIVDYLKNNL